jgi:hypothetical protein
MISYKFKQHHEFIQNKKPRYHTYCDCDIKSWINNNLYFRSEVNDVLHNIHDHVYSHILGRFLSESCINIIDTYVGTIYANHMRDYPQICKVQMRILTLGIPFIHAEDYKLLFENNNIISFPTLHWAFHYRENSWADHYRGNGSRQCSIPKCGAKYFESFEGVCMEHTKQSKLLPIEYIHVHECHECYVDMIQKYKSIISKLSAMLYRDVINHIFSFCVTKKFNKCRGHMMPRKYKCETCIENYSFDLYDRLL